MRSAGWSGTTTRCLEGSKGLQHDMTAALMDSVVPQNGLSGSQQALARSDRAAASCQREQFIAHQMQTHRLGERAVKAMRFHGFPYVVPQFRP